MSMMSTSDLSLMVRRIVKVRGRTSASRVDTSAKMKYFPVLWSLHDGQLYSMLSMVRELMLQLSVCRFMF